MWQSSKADVLAHEKAQATAMTVAVLTNYRVSWYRYAVVTYIRRQFSFTDSKS